MTDYDERINALFEELVPASGKADTVAGEIVRAISKIVYRNYNDGDHIGVGYGCETCNPAARYLIRVCDGNVQQAVLDAWGLFDDDLYDKAVANIERAVLQYLDRRPELKNTVNRLDMFDCADPKLDRDDSEAEWDCEGDCDWDEWDEELRA